MKLATTLAFVLSFSVNSHGWVMDRSCTPYQSTVREGMINAFKLAGAGSDTLKQLSQSSSTPTWIAQKDLLSFLFAETMTNGNIDTNNARWTVAEDMFSSVLQYKTTTDGGAERNTMSYKTLSVSDVIVYCDYSRFEEDKDCNKDPKKGYTCDHSIGQDFQMNKIYSDCKKTGIFSDAVEVSMSPN